ncbi:MAG TPA: Type 1 glutamine amidotransferase-like domain-containing protein [Pyrinomonadaceae bacterium]|nr:Type 1 glutamine amidotransferase-like domain-containing protein [Pyrinomonadaceae bacterium]
MIPVFLIGGGWRSETFPQTYGRFLKAASENKQRRIAVIVAEEPDSNAWEQFSRFFKAFESIGLNSADAFCLIVSAENPLSKEKLAEIKPTGVFVCGGLTPAYHDALCREKSWLDYLFENKIPYCGFSAGASVAAEKAIIGGWQREINSQVIAITNENAGEDLDLLAVRNGLGLVPFAVDVHASQWGTLSRLIHTIDAGFCEKGWAIDENTMLEISRNGVEIFGAGNAYRVKRQKDEITINVFQSKS